MTHRNLDLGRPLRRSDITVSDTFPIQEDELQFGPYCYTCKDGLHSLDDLETLTRSTGVFTLRVVCSMQAPVYLCLEHLPGDRSDLDCFTTEVQEVLRAARRLRDARHPTLTCQPA